MNAIVIRPPIMYGRSQSAIATYILDAAYDAGKKGRGKGEVFETYGYADTRWQTAHQDDVGDLFVRVAERVSGWNRASELMWVGADMLWAGVSRCQPSVGAFD